MIAGKYSLMKKRLRRVDAALFVALFVRCRKVFADEEAIETEALAPSPVLLLHCRKVFADEEAIET